MKGGKIKETGAGERSRRRSSAEAAEAASADDDSQLTAYCPKTAIPFGTGTNT
jgi:hypothetical protein